MNDPVVATVVRVVLGLVVLAILGWLFSLEMSDEW